MTKTILWFRQDLRVADNPALLAAASCGRVLPIYILDDVNAGDWAPGEASRTGLHYSLDALNRSLDGNLRLFRGDAADGTDDSVFFKTRSNSKIRYAYIFRICSCI